MPLKLVPPSIEGVLVRLMQKWRSSRPSASIEEWRKILNDLVAGEGAAILGVVQHTLDKASERAEGYDIPSTYCAGYVRGLAELQAAIKARGDVG